MLGKLRTAGLRDTLSLGLKLCWGRACVCARVRACVHVHVTDMLCGEVWSIFLALWWYGEASCVTGACPGV